MTLAQHASKLNPLDSDYHFAGFGTPNTTPVPDVLFDELMPRLSDIELRVLLYIIRRTFGFKKGTDDISLKQMVEGITTKDGRVLDGGCGLSRPSVTKAVRGLTAKNIIRAIANYSAQRGNEPTTYSLVFLSDIIPSQPDNEGGRNGVTRGGRNAVATQETGETRDRGTRDSNVRMPAREEIFVDNPGDNFRPTPYLDQVITDFSREFGDTLHAASNRKQGRNILAVLGITEERFVEEFVYPARATTRLAKGIDKRMPYFFAVLRDMAEENATRVAGAVRSG